MTGPATGEPQDLVSGEVIREGNFARDPFLVSQLAIT